MSPSIVMSFWVLSALLVITPGVEWAFTIASGLRGRVAPAVCGLFAGHLAATVAVALGAGALVARSPEILTALTILGSAYLAWLGIDSLVRPAVPQSSSDIEVDTRASTLLALQGFAVVGLNPKVYLLFLALPPQFADPSSTWAVSTQMLLLGFAHVATCAVIYSAVGIGAQRVLTARPAAAKNVSRASGVAMLGLGAALALELM